MKFSKKILLSSSLLLLATVAILTAIQAYTVRKELETIENSSLSQMIKEVTNLVETELEGKANLARLTTSTLQLGSMNDGVIQPLIESPILKDEFIAVGFGYEADGHFIENDDDWQVGADYDPRSRPWYRQSKQEQRLIVTEPYVDISTHKSVISLGTPVKQNGKLSGVMFFDVDLSELSKVMDEVHLFDASDMFILTDKGITIAHPDTTKNGESVSNYISNIDLRLGKQYIEQDGRHYQIYISKMPKLGWYIGAIVDEDKAFQSINKMRNASLMYGFFAAIISVAILSLFINFLLRPLRTLNDAIANVASGDGDLTKRLDTNTDKEFATLAQGFNDFSDKLQNQIKESKQLGGEILEETEVIVSGSQQSLETMNQQLQELEQLASAMNEMTVTASDVAHNAQGAATAAKGASDAEKLGSKAMKETTHSINSLATQIEQALVEMQRLESATSNIETVLNVINDIASQTNLLALNAAIEAARAGESGRGFAVVADEVRTLAQRTQDSTSEIGSLIEHLQSGTNQVSGAMSQSQRFAVDAVSKAGATETALDQIQQQIDRINEVSIQIASAAEEQSLVSEEINGNTVRIKDLSNSATTIAEQASDSLASQQNKIQQQDDVLNRFIV